MTFKFLIFKAITNLASFIGYNFTFKRRKNEFEGIYKSYNEALSNSNNIDTYINQRNQSKISILDIEDIEVSNTKNIIPSFYATFDRNKIINFLEVGGGNNPIFQHMLKSTDLKFNCQILEEKNFKTKIPDNYLKNVIYLNDFKNINFNDLEFACFTGSIQYIENFNKILNVIFKNNVKHIFISETFFTDLTYNIFTLQCNILTNKFPNTFFSLEVFDKIFLDNGYKKIFFAKKKNKKIENGVYRVRYSHDSLDPGSFYLADMIYEKVN